LREILIDNILGPWLPPYVACGTGTIIAAENVKRESTQEDVVIYDRSLMPSILASSRGGTEGVFLYNGVLARIEVKSRLTRADLVEFVRSSKEIAALKFSVRPEFVGQLQGAFNLLFAYNSDAKGEQDPDYQFRRLHEVMMELGEDPLGGLISMLCIPPYGFWKIGQHDGHRRWERLTSDDPRDRVVWFLGCISNSTYEQHALRQGRNPSEGIEGGIGFYLPSPFEGLEL
jgi:hypothetical protein